MLRLGHFQGLLDHMATSLGLGQGHTGIQQPGQGRLPGDVNRCQYDQGTYINIYIYTVLYRAFSGHYALRLRKHWTNIDEYGVSSWERPGLHSVQLLDEPFAAFLARYRRAETQRNHDRILKPLQKASSSLSTSCKTSVTASECGEKSSCRPT